MTLTRAAEDVRPYRGNNSMNRPDGRARRPRRAASHERNSQMATKICGFQSRKIAAFLAGLLTGILIGGCCSVFGPGVGVSVY